MSEMLTRVQESAVRLTFKEGDVERSAELRERIAELEQLKTSLLPMEAEAIGVVQRELDKLRKKQRKVGLRAIGAAKLSMDLLTWRRHDGLPSFAIFHPDHKHVTVYPAFDSDDDLEDYSCVYWDNKRGDPRTYVDDHDNEHGRIGRKWRLAAKKIARLYDDIRVQITASFAGVLPPTTRAKLTFFRPLFDGEVYIIAEPKSWTAATLDPDPLLVGRDGDHFWLLDTFDLTSLESLAVDDNGAGCGDCDATRVS